MPNFAPPHKQWSTPEPAKSFALLRRCFFNKQEEDHVRGLHAMPLRDRPFEKVVAG
jgi:hypothetical protein